MGKATARAFALLLAGVALLACGSSPSSMKQYRSPAGYTVSYPASWNVRATAPRTFSASAQDGTEYLVVIVLDASVDQLLNSHRSQLERVSDRTESKEVQTTSGKTPVLWSRRAEKDGRVGVYQQYFLRTAIGTLWVQHGCFEPGPDASESTDRDCDDAGLSILRTVSLD